MEPYQSDPVIQWTRIVPARWGEGGLCICGWQVWDGLACQSHETTIPILNGELFTHALWVDPTMPFCVMVHMAEVVACSVRHEAMP